jgi:hypothetical protein
MRRNMTLIAVGLFLSGCAYSNEVMKVGIDKYQVYALAAPVRGGQAGAQQMAVEAANTKCSSMGKQAEVTDVQTHYSFPANGTATVTFVCK